MEKKPVPEKKEPASREALELLEKVQAITELGDSALVKKKGDSLIVYRLTKKLS